MLAARYQWDANQVAGLTPAQAAMYAEDVGSSADDAIKAVMSGSEGAAGNDPRFPGKKTKTFNSFGEYHQWLRTRG